MRVQHTCGEKQDSEREEREENYKKKKKTQHKDQNKIRSLHIYHWAFHIRDEMKGRRGREGEMNGISHC